MADAEQKETSTVKEIDVKGYKFPVDTDLLDDINTLDLIDRIENKGQVAAILPLLKLIVGAAEFAKMEAYFTEQDAKEHEGKEGYHPRMRMKVIQDVYLAIIEKFDPKG